MVVNELLDLSFISDAEDFSSSDDDELLLSQLISDGGLDSSFLVMLACLANSSSSSSEESERILSMEYFRLPVDGADLFDVNVPAGGFRLLLLVVALDRNRNSEEEAVSSSLSESSTMIRRLKLPGKLVESISDELFCCVFFSRTKW